MEFRERLSRAGLTQELIREVNLDKGADLALAMVRALTGRLAERRVARNEIRSSPSASGEVLPADHYRVQVTYAPLPPFAELNGTLFGWASDLFKSHFTWEDHETCKGIDTTPGKRDFSVKHFGRVMKSQDVIIWAVENGYRVATESEARDFAAAHPDLQRNHWVVALGSFVDSAGDRYVAVLYYRDGERRFGTIWFGRTWFEDNRFLLVRT
ncbi:hypothetical protein A3E39_03770 [Candidatus Uhrbacteria bacterium RIFCSPHIGHO2_12_FULL_60_25]|uniref:Uncharacterized protein n=1 Tax=Candidatus Uhrbacteria bacterium RIFCSPHIGHO2_12_FULL_60_25 TaxID=1802399 RepID=A0A1F7UKM9_9BACT|nr:MAG: hypothetical protein A3D73_00280 [Candidatus Uhrbacteria bacterium RIFCSPHIGHO2_02_FULL_60_44]OGL78258.1 MAG: hypothetical protein A3E39_03770 [Candidatus Uhrbacteria bacterium RIFCSPHIGHO2_12_FULL_60_25]